MTKKPKQIIPTNKEKLSIWQKIGLLFFDKKLLTLAIWLVVMIYGVLSYSTFMRREGFPSVNVPIGVIQVTNFGDDATKVDQDYIKPLSEIAKKESALKSYRSNATSQGGVLQLDFEEGTDVKSSLNNIKKQAEEKGISSEQVQYVEVQASKLTSEGDDILISVHAEGLSLIDLDNKAEELAKVLESQVGLAKEVRVIRNVESVKDPITGQEQTEQTRFDRYYSRETNKVLPSVAVGIIGVKDVDQLELYDQVDLALKTNKVTDLGVEAKIAVDFARSIREQVSGLQRNLIEGLIVVIIISFLFISARASTVTALSMTTTLAITVGVISLIGYSINTITLFSLVLCLALIVDDTTIVVEAIDAGLESKKKFRDVVKEALGKVVRASATGTFTTILAFAPMLFIGGILGGFIRAIPVTIITSLLVSLVVSFVFIPLFMKISYARRHAKKGNKKGIGLLEAKAGNGLASFLLWSTKTKYKSITVKLHAVALVLVLVFLGGKIFTTLEFNIFPSPKDGNEIYVAAEVKDRGAANIESTQSRADLILQKAVEVSKDNIEYITLLSQNGTNQNGFTATIKLKEYQKRDITSVQIAEKLNTELAKIDTSMIVKAEAGGVGPPAGSFTVNVNAEGDFDAATKLANDLQKFLNQKVLERIDGSKAKIINSSVTPPVLVSRVDGERVLGVSAQFDAKDTSTLTNLTQDAIDDEFNKDKIKSYGLEEDSLTYDLGQEQDNQDSFSSMGKAVGPLFIAMIILMAVLFGSVMQSFLILTALPFAFFGVASGLALTDNAISFFTMLGIFALVGISVNNAILLTDFANQERDNGKDLPTAMAHALQARLRPLLTTSITSVLALLPLALSDPFWEGIAFTLIFGLLSSTILVIFVFPYFYLIEEGLRLRIRKVLRKIFRRKTTG